ncbi:hypothetical protein NHX12_022468 [Muraenolepis orangiensis]|uniref:non-specific serine/threonine protein kinase n=1 Tax=Muraenolepis orangiensis TaxID=630683 RepID=A0A9Q0IV40_9TELE|nr:hypothetical protein NHX12_022468 [Muraenolepis orangiensis]
MNPVLYVPQQIMKDHWMNVGHEEEELKPYTEPETDFNDTARIELMITMGFPKDEVTESLLGQKYDDVMATYLLLGRKAPESRAASRPIRSSGATAIMRGQALSVESDHREEWDGARRLELNTSKGDVPASPLGVQERKKTASAVGTNGSMTRRNTYVCERSSTERYSPAIPNGKDSSLTEVSGSTPSTTASSTRPRHTKSMSASGHPSKSPLPPIEDNTELKASSSPRGPSSSPSAHSISTPEKNRFPRGTTSRSTFHGAQLRDRRSATYNGPPASPTLSHDTGALAQQRRGTSTGIIGKITSKFVRRAMSFRSTPR